MRILALALRFLVPGPLFITASLPLLAFKWRPTIAMAVAASAIGALFGFAIALEGMSTDDGMWFTLGAGTTAVIAGLAVAIGWRRFARSWFALPVRIRSWILAIGIMLTAIGVQTFHMADPKDFYEEMVAAGGGRMLGQYMLAGWKNMHPDEQYFSKFIDLYEHIEDKCYIERTEQFERWYENPIDLPAVATTSRLSNFFSRKTALPRASLWVLDVRCRSRPSGAPFFFWRASRRYNDTRTGIRGGAAGLASRVSSDLARPTGYPKSMPIADCGNRLLDEPSRLEQRFTSAEDNQQRHQNVMKIEQAS